MSEIKKVCELTGNEVFTGTGGSEDIRGYSFWRLADKKSGSAIQIRPPKMTDVEEGGLKVGTFFNIDEEVRVFDSIS